MYLMENHDEAYYIWRDAGVRQRTLLHVDAHHDLYGEWPARGHKPVINIANYIYPAIEEGIVSEVFWIVPDESWKTPADLSDIVRVLPARSDGRKPVVSDTHISTEVLGRPLVVCTLAHLPDLSGPLLLDIDVDYLVIPDTGYRRIDRYGRAPWCWPGELTARLRSIGATFDVITIAYSVEGGYTPLQWKYLGDELALRLDGNHESPLSMEAVELMHEGFLSARCGELTAAQWKYRTAVECAPGSAAPMYHLAHVLAAMGKMEGARDLYRKALEADASYRTPYDNPGLWYYLNGRLLEAQESFKRVLTLDADNAFAHFGVGLVAAKKGEWELAEISVRRALSLNEEIVDAHRLLGTTLARRARYAEAAQSLERSMTLALRGHRSVTENLILSHAREGHWSDPGHGETHNRLGRIYALQGDLARAISSYRFGSALGADGVSVRVKLACLYLRKREWWKALCQMGLATAWLPATFRKAASQGVVRFRRTLRNCSLEPGTQSQADEQSLWN